MKLVLILLLSFMFLTPTVLARKVFIEFGTDLNIVNEIGTPDNVTLADIKVKYGDRDWRELQYSPVTHEKRYNKDTGLYEAYSLADKKADQDAARAIKDADKDEKRESLRLKLGLTKQEMDDLTEIMK